MTETTTMTEANAIRTYCVAIELAHAAFNRTANADEFRRALNDAGTARNRHSDAPHATYSVTETMPHGVDVVTTVSAHSADDAIARTVITLRDTAAFESTSRFTATPILPSLPETTTMTTTTTTTTVKSALAAAFKSLRKQGVYSRMTFTCCQSCGWHGMHAMEQKHDGYTFFHKQDAESFNAWGNLTDSLMLSHSGNPDTPTGFTHEGAAALIVNTLRDHGLHVNYAGNTAQRIEVVGLA